MRAQCRCRSVSSFRIGTWPACLVWGPLSRVIQGCCRVCPGYERECRVPECPHRTHTRLWVVPPSYLLAAIYCSCLRFASPFRTLPACPLAPLARPAALSPAPLLPVLCHSPRGNENPPFFPLAFFAFPRFQKVASLHLHPTCTLLASASSQSVLSRGGYPDITAFLSLHCNWGISWNRLFLLCTAPHYLLSFD